MEVSGRLHIPAALPLAMEPSVPIATRVGGLQSQYGRGGEVTNLYSCSESNRGRPACSQSLIGFYP
jgi:hypothetical protein